MAHTPDGASRPSPATDGLRLLVVDDNPDAADTLSLLLHYWGHQPTVAYDAPAAVRSAVAEPPDAVFLDLGLPGCDGFDIAGRLRQTEGLGRVPLVALTGYADPHHRNRAAECGFDLFLVKPVDELVLQAVPAQVAEVRRMARRACELSADGKALAVECRALLREHRLQMETMRKTLESMGAWALEANDGEFDGAVQ
jgi:CheY-like chemotaxis protein